MGYIWSSKEESICNASRKGDVDTVYRMLGEGVDPSQYLSGGMSSIHFASYMGHVHVVEALLDGGTNIEVKSQYSTFVTFSSYDCTALHFAARGGHADVARLLMEKGANVLARDSLARTPLHIASQKGHLEAVEALLSGGADIEARTPDDQYFTPLHFAAKGGHTEVVKLLLDQGADVLVRDTMARTPLTFAQNTRNAYLSQILESAEKYSLKNEEVDLCDTIFMREVEPVDTSSQDHQSSAPLRTATQKGDLREAEALLHEDADVETKTKKESFLAGAYGYATMQIRRFAFIAVVVILSLVAVVVFLFAIIGWLFANIGSQSLFAFMLWIAHTSLKLGKAEQNANLPQALEAKEKKNRGMMALSYTPAPHEQAYYEGLFAAAKADRSGDTNDGEAFFSRSGLPRETLTKILKKFNHSKAHALERREFDTAVRLIQLAQNGQRGEGEKLVAPAGVTLRPAMFEGISGALVPLPPEEQDLEPSEEMSFLSHLYQECHNINTMASLITFIEQLLQKIANVHEMKLFCSMIMTISRQGDLLEWEDSKSYIQRALEAATCYCHDRKSIAIYKTVLKYYQAQGILDDITMFELDNDAEVNRMEHAKFIVDMRKAIQHNTQRIQHLEKSVEDLQKNLDILDQNIRNVQDELQGLKESMRRKHRIQSGICIISAVVNAATFGIGGNLVQAIDSIFNGIVDFGNTEHVQAIVQRQNSPEAMERFQEGTELVCTHLENMGEAYADSQLDRELKKESSPLLVLGVVCAMNDASIPPPRSTAEPQQDQPPAPRSLSSSWTLFGAVAKILIVIVAWKAVGTKIESSNDASQLFHDMPAHVRALEKTYGISADSNDGILQRLAQLESMIGISGEGMNLMDRIVQLEQL